MKTNRERLQDLLEQINATQAKRMQEYGGELLPYLLDSTSKARNMIMKALYTGDFSDMEGIERTVRSAKSAIQPKKVKIQAQRLQRLGRIQDVEKIDGRYQGGTAHDTFGDIMDQIRKSDRDEVRSWDSQEVLEIGKVMAEQGDINLWTAKDIRKALEKHYGEITPEQAFGEKPLDDRLSNPLFHNDNEGLS